MRYTYGIRMVYIGIYRYTCGIRIVYIGIYRYLCQSGITTCILLMYYPYRSRIVAYMAYFKDISRCSFIVSGISMDTVYILQTLTKTKKVSNE